MDRDEIKRLLERVRSGELEIGAALDELSLAPVERLGYATLDLHRAVRPTCPKRARMMIVAQSMGTDR